MIESLNWHVVCSVPQQEIRASIELARAEFDVFYPIRKYIRRRVGRPPEEVTGPLFPRYVFAKFDRNGVDLWKIRGLRGVSDVLCNGGKPVIVRASLVEQIRSYREPEEPSPVQAEFATDQRVRITGGVLQGIEGLFKGSDRQRTKAFLEILGKRWDIPFQNISAA
jgi:transcription antitermination factor NusG